MIVSYNWLASLVEQTPSWQEVALRLTAAGLEVEGSEELGLGLDRVVVGHVLSKEKIAGSDKLHLCRVDVGAGAPVQIVCGASNYEAGAKVPAALEGAKLPGGLVIGKAKLKGVESFGMLCSGKELGLDEDHGGLLLLEPDAVVGTPIADHLCLRDVALTLNVTPNRADWLSHLGVARELVAATGLPLRAAEAGPEETGAATEARIAVFTEAPDRCARYAARVVEGVKVGPSPRWMQGRLRTCGVRALGNVVDVTNYVMLELGQPLHGFDLEHVRGGRVGARLARAGEQLVTLDGKERALDPSDLVIADAERALVLAGIMGGADSEVTAGTTRVLLEAANFAGVHVRRSSRRHGLASESSHRFERGVDPHLVPRALDRAARLLEQLCKGAETRRGIADAWPAPTSPAEVALRWSRVDRLLGVAVPPGEARRILVSLGLRATREDGEGAVFSVPTNRPDLTREADLIEEVARLRGYDAIPEALPAAGFSPVADAPELRLQTSLREALSAAGLHETLNYSFVERGRLTALSAPAPLRLKNPISEELAVMRTSLLAGLLENVRFNRNREGEALALYEIGRVYLAEPQRDQPVAEPLRVAGVLTGRARPTAWTEGDRSFDLWDVKAVVEALLAAAGVRGARFSPGDAAHLHPRSATAIHAGERLLGGFGELHPSVADGLGLPRGLFVFELTLQALLEAASPRARYEPLPRFPAVLRDVAVVVDATVPAAKVLELLSSAPHGGLLEGATLFDVYEGPQVGAGKKSLAVALRYRAADRTLKDEEVQAAHGALLAALERELKVQLRA